MFSKKVSLPVAAGVGAILMAVCGIITPKVMLQQYSSSTIATMFGMMVIGGALFHTGAALYMGHFLTKFTRNEKGLVLVCVIFGTIMSSIMSRSTCFFMFLPIIVSIALASDISLQKLLLSDLLFFNRGDERLGEIEVDDIYIGNIQTDRIELFV